MNTRLLMPQSHPRPIAFDVRADGIDYRVCPRCIHNLRYADAEADPVYKIAQGEIEFCEECDQVLMAKGAD
jgi:hypothetical protein